ncbi:MAG: hypothetical protein Q7S66_03865 [bacterium]|nr:hypothetical protein [bacterium]
MISFVKLSALSFVYLLAFFILPMPVFASIMTVATTESGFNFSTGNEPIVVKTFILSPGGTTTTSIKPILMDSSGNPIGSNNTFTVSQPVSGSSGQVVNTINIGPIASESVSTVDAVQLINGTCSYGACVIIEPTSVPNAVESQNLIVETQTPTTVEIIRTEDKKVELPLIKNSAVPAVAQTSDESAVEDQPQVPVEANETKIKKEIVNNDDAIKDQDKKAEAEPSVPVLESVQKEEKPIRKILTKFSSFFRNLFSFWKK